MKRFDKIFNKLYMVLNNKQKHMVTVSAGVASTDECLPDELLKQADKLMYENKKEFYKDKVSDQRKIKAL
jgi:PleD family two-component response regulator